MATKYPVRIWCETCGAYKYTIQDVIDDTWKPVACAGHTTRDFVMKCSTCCCSDYDMNDNDLIDVKEIKGYDNALGIVLPVAGTVSVKGTMTGWYDVLWLYRLTITSQNVRVAEAITNAYVDLAELPAGFWAHVKNGGGDIRMTESDGTTEVAREIVACDTVAETGEVHFDCTGIETGSDVTWYIYYGNVAATDYAEDDEFGREAVYDAYCKAVYHLGEAAGVALDSTSNDHDGTFMGNLPDPQPGKIGYSQDHDGNLDYEDLGDPADFFFDTQDLRLTCWVRFNTLVCSQNMQIFMGHGQDPQDSNNASRFGFSNTAGWIFHLLDSGIYRVNMNKGNVVGIAINTWYKLEVIRSGSDWTLLVDNAVIDTDTYAGSWIDYTGHFFLGRGPATTPTYERELNGRLDEARIEKGICRSANWRATEFNNQDDVATFWAIGAEEDDPDYTEANLDVQDKMTAASSQLGGSGAEPTEYSTDGTLGGNSDTAIPTEKAVKTYVDAEKTPADARVKGWIQFSMSGAGAIADSFNVSSITDIGVGNWDVNWDTDFANGDYAVVGSAFYPTSGVHNWILTMDEIVAGNVRVTVGDNSGTEKDSAKVSVMAIGDQ